MKSKRLLALVLAALALMILAFAPLAAQRFDWVISKKLTVLEGGATFQSNVTLDSTADLSLGDDLDITGDLRVGNGTPSVTQDGEDAYIEGQFEVDGEAQFDGAIDANSTVQVDGATTFGVDGTGVDVRFYSDTAGDSMLWDESEEALTIVGTDAQDALNVDDGNVDIADDLDVDGTTNLDDVDIDLTASLNIDGHMVDIGTGSYATADGDNDLGVAGDLEVDGATDLDGTLAVAGAATMASDVTVSADASGGNAGARSQLIGMPAIRLVTLSTMTNGATESANYLDDSPTGEWSEVDGGTNITVTADSAIYRTGTTSLQIEFSDVVTDEGVVGTAGAQDDLSGNESIGFWIYSDVAITAGDFNLVVDDSNGTDQEYDIGAVTANLWTWKEIDISGCDANCDTMDNIKVLATAQGAANLTAANVYLDGMWKWDANDEEALGVNLVQDGVLSVLVATTTTTTTMTALTEQTDFVVNYQSGNDVAVTVTNQSANSGIALVAYQ